MPIINSELMKGDTPAREADLGKILGSVFNETIYYLRDTNNAIMKGSGGNKATGATKLLDYLKGGGFVAFEGVNKNEVSNGMTGMFIGTAVNHVWRNQKVGIVGGLPCGEDLGIGLGPKEYEVCRDGKAWYIYHWEEEKQAGSLDGEGVIMPHGMDLLGQGPYESITWQNAILSSLAAWDTAGLDYSNDTQLERFKNAVETGTGDIFSRNWEGVFNIPVCDVGLVPYVSDFEDKDNVLTPYGPEEEIKWCGAVCNVDQLETDKFLKVANMENFDDNPKDHC